jgi:hypothetical protein
MQKSKKRGGNKKGSLHLGAYLKKLKKLVGISYSRKIFSVFFSISIQLFRNFVFLLGFMKGVVVCVE